MKRRNIPPITRGFQFGASALRIPRHAALALARCMTHNLYVLRLKCFYSFVSDQHQSSANISSQVGM